MEFEIGEIFNESQYSTASHQKLIVALYRILLEVDLESFCYFIKRVVAKILLEEYKTPNINVEKVIQFLISFLTHLKLRNGTSEGEENPVLSEILNYLMLRTNLDNHVIRYRCCEILGLLFDKLAGLSVNAELFDEIVEALLERTKDPKVDIRLQALKALHRLQDPRDPEDPLITKYIQALYDISVKVRRLAVEKIALRRDILKHIVGRTRDTDASVRLAAYTRLSKLVKALKIAQRQQVLMSGSIEENQKVKQYVTATLTTVWFEQYNLDYLDIIEALRLDADEKDIANTVKSTEILLRCLFKSISLSNTLNAIPVDDSNTIPFEKLNWQTIILWRVLVQYLRQNENFENTLSNILPDLVDFCEYIQKYCIWKPKAETEAGLMEQQFILQQLLIIALDYDISDVVARRSLEHCISTLLQNVDLNTNVIDLTMRILERCIPNVERRCYYVSEIIGEIMYPTNTPELIQTQDDFREMKNQYQIVTMNKISSEKAEDYLKAAECHKQLEELKVAIKDKEIEINKQMQVTRKTDVCTIKKYLDIAAALLSSAQVTALTPNLTSLKDEVIQECLIHYDEDVKAKALKCYVLCCIVDEATAKCGIHICAIPILDYHLGKTYELPILPVAIRGIVDILLIYGYDLLAEPDTENLSESMSEQHRATFTGGTSLTTIIQGLTDIIDDEDPEMSVLAVTGLCRLLSDGSLESPSLISRLILKWASPATDTAENSIIKQLIGNTLNHLAQHTSGAYQLQNAVLPTIRALVGAPSNSPLQEVQADVIKFLVALCSTAVNSTEMQAQLAVSTCDLIRSNPSSAFNVVYTEVLLLLQLPKTKRFIADLLDDCDALLDEILNRKVLNNIRKFIGKLQKLEREDVASGSENEDGEGENENSSSVNEEEASED